MKNIIRFYLTIFIIFFLESPVLAAVSSIDLIERAKEYDGKEISYQGEVIREAMIRGKYAWLNVSDGNNTIGVLIDAGLIGYIREYGAYHTKGDTVRVTGVFHRSCPEHGGDLDLHADSLAVVKQGAKISQAVKTDRVILAVLFVVTAVIAYFIDRYRKRRLGV